MIDNKLYFNKIKGDFLLLVVAFFILSGSCTSKMDNINKEKFNLYLMIGQSNMAGRGTVSLSDRRIVSQAFMMDKNLKWTSLREPVHFDKKSAGTGIGRVFASEMVKSAKPGVRIGLIPCAVGGTSIETWQAGVVDEATGLRPYDDMLIRLREASKYGELKGVLFHQGESDSNKKMVASYPQSLLNLIDRLKEETGNPNLPFLIGQMGHFPGHKWNKYRSAIDATHKRIAQEDFNIEFISSHGLSDRDGTHFNSKSYREFGRRYAFVMQRLLFHQPVPEQEIPLYGQELDLYPDPIINHREVEHSVIRGSEVYDRFISNIESPTLAFYFPVDGVVNKHTAVIISPGGGYSGVSYDKEGTLVARRLAQNGITGVVLKYRMPDVSITKKGLPRSQEDLFNALAYVRGNSELFGVDSDKIGVAGFSAGGHLAASASVLKKTPDALLYAKGGISCLPDFSLLGYPVISTKPRITHSGTAKKVSGGIAELLEYYSLEDRVHPQVKPVFIFHANDDSTVPVLNAEWFESALLDAGVSVCFKRYSVGGHGFGMYPAEGNAGEWFSSFLNWLEAL